MGVPVSNPPKAPQEPSRWHNPVTHGSKAAIGATVFAGVAMIATMWNACTNWENRSDQTVRHVQEQADAHINSLIDAKLSPAAKDINNHIDTKIDGLSAQIQALDIRIARLEGPLARKVAQLEKQSQQQASLAKVLDPNRTLATIRMEIDASERSGHLLSVSDVLDYKNIASALPQTAYQYWQTAAAIINYQSKINQLSGEAPDPNKVSGPCFGLTSAGSMTQRSNSFIGAFFSSCVVDVDTNLFANTVFKDSVIRYHGGKVRMSNVTFINCWFQLDVPPGPSPVDRGQQFLVTLLSSADQKHILFR